MHEVSLNRVITDYLTGQEIMDTTYEDLRQALAKLLVEDRKYPREFIRSKYELAFSVNGEPHSVAIDLAVFSEQSEPLLALFFCPGEVGTFVRESLAAARIHLPAPFPLVLVTDSMELHLVETKSGELLGQGFNA
ncbi:MAG: type I restriction enzyme HsdR N-terminal domain-containing protein, partial [Desulfomicrobium sp.]|nr:type I restriction enzyme HsdR N-terminal domain-containing protein [Desulfomicrobium sp.]